jgi:outer membrane protein OmpA-like peptidoglycan-associated protein
VAGLEGRLGQTDTKANKALESLANLRLERRFVLDLKEGATFAFSSAVLTDPTKREIDGFLNDLKGEGDGMLFLVTGHTDSRGREDLNYELGRKRAESVSRYLIAQRKIDPTRVLTVSYGPSAPLAENNTREGRSKNRRIEILVFKEGISTAATTPEKMAERAERRK